MHVTTYQITAPLRIDTQAGKTRVQLDLPKGTWTPATTAEQTVADQLVAARLIHPTPVVPATPATPTTRRPRRKE